MNIEGKRSVKIPTLGAGDRGTSLTIPILKEITNLYKKALFNDEAFLVLKLIILNHQLSENGFGIGGTGQYSIVAY